MIRHRFGPGWRDHYDTVQRLGNTSTVNLVDPSPQVLIDTVRRLLGNLPEGATDPYVEVQEAYDAEGFEVWLSYWQAATPEEISNREHEMDTTRRRQRDRDITTLATIAQRNPDLLEQWQEKDQVPDGPPYGPDRWALLDMLHRDPEGTRALLRQVLDEEAPNA